MAQQIAQGAVGLPKIPLSPVMCAVLLGMLWRNTWVPCWATSGLNWTMHRLLRVGIALVGLRLTLGGAGAIAITALPVALTCLTVALLARMASPACSPFPAGSDCCWRSVPPCAAAPRSWRCHR